MERCNIEPKGTQLDKVSLSSSKTNSLHNDQFSPDIEASDCESDVSVGSVELYFQHHSRLFEGDVAEDSILDDLIALFQTPIKS